MQKVSHNGATEWISFSLDTDIFVLGLRDTQNFMTGTGKRPGTNQLRPIYLPFGDLNTKPPPSLHSFSGADTVARKENFVFLESI